MPFVRRGAQRILTAQVRDKGSFTATLPQVRAFSAPHVPTRLIEDKANGGRIYSFSPGTTREGAAVLSARLLAFWDGDGWVSNPEDFEKVLAQQGDLSNCSPKVQIAEKPERR